MGILINGGALGDRGVLNFSQGYATTSSHWSTTVLASDSIIAARTEGIDRSITNIDKRRSDLEARLVNIEKRYRAQFTALDTMLSSMNNTSTFLTQQLASLPAAPERINQEKDVYTNSQKCRHAYANVGLETGVVAANPHQLIVMLYEGAELAVRMAIKHMNEGDIAKKSAAISARPATSSWTA